MSISAKACPSKIITVVSELELMPVRVLIPLPNEFHAMNLLCHDFVGERRGREA